MEHLQFWYQHYYIAPSGLQYLLQSHDQMIHQIPILWPPNTHYDPHIITHILPTYYPYCDLHLNKLVAKQLPCLRYCLLKLHLDLINRWPPIFFKLLHIIGTPSPFTMSIIAHCHFDPLREICVCLCSECKQTPAKMCALMFTLFYPLSRHDIALL